MTVHCITNKNIARAFDVQLMCCSASFATRVIGWLLKENVEKNGPSRKTRKQSKPYLSEWSLTDGFVSARSKQSLTQWSNWIWGIPDNRKERCSLPICSLIEEVYEGNQIKGCNCVVTTNLLNAYEPRSPDKRC